MLSVLVLCFSVAAVSGELCEFPNNHPIRRLEIGENIPVQPTRTNTIYSYTDQFGFCHGRVKKINFCYRPHSDELLMTIEIRSANGTILDSYNVYSSARDRLNCKQRYSLHFTSCCVEHVLTESFEISDPSNYYALRIPNTASLLLRQSDDTLPEFLYKPLFYFTIDTIRAGNDVIDVVNEMTAPSPAHDDNILEPDSSVTVHIVISGVMLVVVVLIALMVSLVILTLCCLKRHQIRQKLKNTPSNMKLANSNTRISAGSQNRALPPIIPTTIDDELNSDDHLTVYYDTIVDNIRRNVAYQANQSEVQLNENVAYNPTNTNTMEGVSVARDEHMVFTTDEAYKQAI